MSSNKYLKIGIIGNGGEWSGLPVVRELGKNKYKTYILFQNIKSVAEC